MAIVSIIIPIHNSSKYLKQCLNSVLHQTFENIEVIAIDDNSNDDSLDILKSFEKVDNRLKVIHLDDNFGPGYCRNLGLEEATGKYIGFVDSDDYIDQNMYKELFLGAERNNVEIARCDKTIMLFGLNYNKLITFPEKNKKDVVIVKPKRNPKYLEFENCECWNKIYKHDFVDKFRFDEDLKYEDYPFVMKALGTANRIFSLQKTMYYHRYRKNSLTWKEKKEVDLGIFDIFKCNQEIMDYYIGTGLYITYAHTLNEICFNHAISKCPKFLTMPLSKKDKYELINAYLRYIELETKPLKENEMYERKKDNSSLFKYRMEYIEKHILDNRYSDIDDKELIMNKMKKLIMKNTSRNN